MGDLKLVDPHSFFLFCLGEIIKGVFFSPYLTNKRLYDITLSSPHFSPFPEFSDTEMRGKRKRKIIRATESVTERRVDRRGGRLMPTKGLLGFVYCS